MMYRRVRIIYPILSIIFLIFVILPGLDFAIQDYKNLTVNEADPCKSQPELFTCKSPNFIIMDISLPFLLLFLVLYNIFLFSKIKPLRLFFGVGLLISLIATIYGLYIGNRLEWSVSPGGLNQGSVFIGIALTFTFLVVTFLHFYQQYLKLPHRKPQQLSLDVA